MAVHTLANQGVNLIQKCQFMRTFHNIQLIFSRYLAGSSVSGSIWNRFGESSIEVCLFTSCDPRKRISSDYLNNKNKKENLPSNVELHFVYQTDRVRVNCLITIIFVCSAR